MTADQTPTSGTARKIDELVFIGLNRQVVALDRYTGEILWEWKAPEGTGFVSILVDGDRLIAAVNGYLYCLDPIFGQEVWRNPMKGFGLGTTSLASANGSTSVSASAAAMQAESAQAAGATAATTTG